MTLGVSMLCLHQGLQGAVARQPSRQHHQERRQHHYSNHLRDDGRVGCVRAHRTCCGHHLGHLVDGRSDVDAEPVGAAGDQRPVPVQLEQRRVQEDRQRAEHHHRGHRHRDLLGARLDHRLGGHHRSSAADGTASADQHRRLALQAQPARADEAGQCEGRAQYHRVDGDTSYANMVNVLHGEPQAVQHHAQAKQVLLGEVDAGAAGYRPARGPRVNRVAHDHAQHDGQRQRTEAMVLQPGDAAQRDTGGSQGAAQGQAGEHACESRCRGRCAWLRKYVDGHAACLRLKFMRTKLPAS